MWDARTARDRQQGAKHMKPVLVVYATGEGWTGRVSERIGARLTDAGIPNQVAYVTALPEPFDLTSYGGVIVAGSMHFSKYQKELVAFVKERAAILSRSPGAFV